MSLPLQRHNVSPWRSKLSNLLVVQETNDLTHRRAELLPFVWWSLFFRPARPSSKFASFELSQVALRRSENKTKHDFKVTSDLHAELTGNKPKVIWFTGLSGSGKSTIANELSKELYKQSKPHYVLDGDNLRFGLNRDLGFTEADRTENIRRTAETAKLMADAGLIVLDIPQRSRQTNG